ncbi:MAG: YHYH protein [Planctomycetota bacterium]
MNRKLTTLFVAGLIGAGALVFAQPPRGRTHRVTEKGTLNPLPATASPPTESKVEIEIVDGQRVIRSNGIPNHPTGQFPNRGNPNVISAQRHEYRVPAEPKMAGQVSPLRGEFGIAVNGVPFDPGAAEFYEGNPGWQYEPLSGAIALGIDVSHAHVQPTGKYHYHGLPTGLLDHVNLKPSEHSPLIGWAADGFPIYAVYGYTDPKESISKSTKLRSSYQLRKGNRPGGDSPDGTYDGTFVQDYVYVAGSGDLDECNGRFTVTPDFPNGTYAYFLTEEWPVVPRNYRGTPSDDFRHGPPMGGRPGGAMDGGREFGGPPNGRGFGPPGRGGDRFGGGRGDGGGFGAQGAGPGSPPKPGEILPSFLRRSLNLSEAQQEKLDALQKTVDDELSKILTQEQRQQLEQQGPPPGNQSFGRDQRRGDRDSRRPGRPSQGDRPR